jgi:xylulokinase
MAGVDHDRLADLALATEPGAAGLVLVPYLEGERTPNRPNATGAIHGLRLATATPGHLARAAVEGMLCALADGLDALVAEAVAVRRVVLVGGGAKSRAVREIAPAVFGVPVVAPPEGESVADGAARQAAWVLLGGDNPPEWTAGDTRRYEAEPTPGVREAYARARELVTDRPA